jgi:L-threonate 2-dehydrogenase
MNVGFIGIGNMGSAMAQRLLSLSWPVAVHDIDATRVGQAQALGARACATPSALASACDCMVVCVVDARQTDSVLFGPNGAAGALASGGCVMLCPTVAPADTERFAAALAERGIACIDAPMSGGPARALDGSMSLMVACAAPVFEHHRTLIDALSSKVFRISERVGDGARTKLVNNLLAGINLAGAAEVMALAERIGLDLAATLEVIEQSSGQSWIGADRMRRAIAGDFAPRAHTRLLNKDTHLALAMANDAGFDPGLGALAAGRFAEACSAGFEALDDASLFTLLRGSHAEG